MILYCCGCEKKIKPRLTNGKEIYPHRPDLYKLPFWKCDGCGNFVGCHHKTKNPTAPLGCIPTPEIKELRKEIHKILDPIWKSGISRSKLYSIISEKIGYEYHTANIRSIEEGNKILKMVEGMGKL